MKSEIIITLKKLGFTEYEAKAYLALLEKSPLSGYGVALNSGVPRSKIYEVLDGMAQNKEVILSYGAPVLYSPLPPKELISQRRKKNDENFEAAFSSLEAFSSSPEDRDNIWNISGHDEVINKAIQIINNSKESILLEIWKEDYHIIEDALKNASDRGIKTTVVFGDELELEKAKIYKRTDEVQDTEQSPHRSLSICADNEEALSGVISLENASLAATSTHPGLVVPVTKLINQSILLSELIKKNSKMD